MAWVSTWFYAAHRLLSALEHGQASYGHQTPVWLKFRLAFSSSRTTSWTLFRNLHTAAKRSRGESSELWARATVPPVRPAKRQVKRLTCRGVGALAEASVGRSTGGSSLLHLVCARKG